MSISVPVHTARTRRGDSGDVARTRHVLVDGLYAAPSPTSSLTVLPPHTIHSVPVQTDWCLTRPVPSLEMAGLAVRVELQVFDTGL